MARILLFAALFLILPARLTADTVEFFEKKYGVKLPGIKPIEEYDDPDSFYTAIAAKLGIPALAKEAVAAKFGWKEDENRIANAIVRRGPNTDHWEILVFRFDLNPDTRRPEVGSMEGFFVTIDDDKETRSVEHYDEMMRRKRKEQEEKEKAPAPEAK